MVLTLAEKYGRPPEEVEQWDAYWFERAAEFAQGEAMYMNKKLKK
jgi:hypothetical protein